MKNGNLIMIEEQNINVINLDNVKVTKGWKLGYGKMEKGC